MKFENLLSQFGADHAIDLTPEDDACTVSFDDMPVTIQAMPEGHAILLHAAFGDKPSVAPAQFYEALLMANHLFQGTAGATISLDPETKQLHLCQILAEEQMDNVAFSKALEKFVNTLDTWRTALAQYQPRSQNDSNPTPDAEMPASDSIIRI